MNTTNPTDLAQRWFDNTDPNTYDYSRCMRCMDSWKFKKSHATMHSDSRGVSPLCADCWDGLTPEERLPFYEAIILVWERQTGSSEVGDVRPQIHAAVLAGL